jgi:hypothetical protein
MEHDTFSMRRTLADAIESCLSDTPMQAMRLGFAGGLYLGLGSRLSDAPVMIAGMPAADLLSGGKPTMNRVFFYSAYAAGASVAYADKIYAATARAIDMLK